MRATACKVKGGLLMAVEYILTGIVALAVGVYLLVALLKPDLF